MQIASDDPKHEGRWVALVVVGETFSSDVQQSIFATLYLFGYSAFFPSLRSELRLPDDEELRSGRGQHILDDKFAKLTFRQVKLRFT